MEKKIYHSADIRDMLFEFSSLLSKLEKDLVSPLSLEHGLLVMSLMSSWMLTFYRDKYPYIFYEVLRSKLSIETNEAMNEQFVKRTCRQLHLVLRKYQDDVIAANRSITKIVVSHQLEFDAEMLGENFAFSQQLNSLTKKSESEMSVVSNGDVLNCKKFRLKLETEIITELAPVIAILSQYFGILQFTELDEVEIATDFAIEPFYLSTDEINNN